MKFKVATGKQSQTEACCILSRPLAFCMNRARQREQSL